MAARRRKKKKARRKKKASRRRSTAALNVVVGSKVKETIKSYNVRCSGDMVEALNAHVHGILKQAVERCIANKRGTVRPQDL